MKKSIPIIILGMFLAFLGFLMTLILLAVAVVALAKHTPLTELLENMDLMKEDCLGLILPILPFYWVNLTYSILLWLASLGLLFAQEWGRKIVVALGIIELLWTIGDFTFAHKVFKIHHGVEIVIILVIIVFLNLPASREKFKKASGTV